jgi:hypothetical protein
VGICSSNCSVEDPPKALQSSEILEKNRRQSVSQAASQFRQTFSMKDYGRGRRLGVGHKPEDRSVSCLVIGTFVIVSESAISLEVLHPVSKETKDKRRTKNHVAFCQMIFHGALFIMALLMVFSSFAIFAGSVVLLITKLTASLSRQIILDFVLPRQLN